LTAISFPATNHLHRWLAATEIQKLPSFSMTGATRLHDKPKRPLQTSYAASVADTLFWPRRDHRRFLLPRPRIQDESRDFACRIPDESDPGVIFVIYDWQFDHDFALFDWENDRWVAPLLQALLPAAATR
jgi:hypothetical protein